MASGEMSAAGFEGFLERAIKRAIQNTTNGSIHHVFMDWRHMPALKGLIAKIPCVCFWNHS
jgi:hypothetical protein